ncbi:SDR family oxidoreductase [Candidatus Kaiserbacteria bacterium]|nr:SDR family oxidoreductase [Candidatus Kaiserbacteria bacterium]
MQQKGSMKTILITGGCGYLGSQLVRDFGLEQTEPVNIRILDSLRQDGRRALMDLPQGPRYEFIEGDILDPSALAQALADVDTVIHLAAVVRTPLSFDNPAWLEQVNHWGTAHLVDACIAAGVRRFVYASSTAVYGPGGPFSEADTCRAQGHYAQSKLRAEAAVQSGRERGLETIILRLGLLYGLAPVTRFDAVANRLAYLAGVGRPLTVFGDGEQRRPFLHVRDASRALRLAVHGPGPDPQAAVINIAGDNVSVLTLVETLVSLRPETRVHFTEQDIRTHYSFEVYRGRALEMGWTPQVALDEGLEEIVGQFAGVQAPVAPTLEID